MDAPSLRLGNTPENPPRERRRRSDCTATVTGVYCVNKKQLSEPKQWIVDQCQLVNFGRISFHIQRGEPDLTRPWRTRRTVKLGGGENGPRPEATLTDFKLREEQASLLDALSHVGEGQRVAVEVRHGLPFILEIEQDHQAA